MVHDYVTQRGGAERVVLDLLRAFPGARLVTSCYDPRASFPDFDSAEIETLWPDRVAALRRDPRRAFPVLGSAFARHHIDDADVVICSSSGWSHRVHSRAPKIVYCHNPARWLYQPDDYLGALPVPVRRMFSWAVRAGGVARRDAAAARSAALYAVNSTVVRDRVRAAYAIDATVVAPARGLSPQGEQREVPGIEPGYWLTVGRARGYKNTEAVCAAVAADPSQRVVVVGGLPDGTWPHHVLGPREVDDAQLRWLYANARGLIAVAREDFGLTPVEAQAFGVPVLALRDGGYLDTTVEGVTGLFVDHAEPEAIRAGLRAMADHWWHADEIRAVGAKYAPEAFAGRMRALVDEVTT